MDLKINSLILDCKDKEKWEILIKLKSLNMEAYTNYFSAPYKTHAQNYKELQRSIVWAEARTLLLKYFNGVKCSVCGEHLNNNAQLHHKTYNFIRMECFTPEFVEFLHRKCHLKQDSTVKAIEKKNRKK